MISNLVILCYLCLFRVSILVVMKAKRLTYFKLPYVVPISKIIEHFYVDVEGELEESTGPLNQVSTLNMHKIGFTKVGNAWLVEGEQATNIEVEKTKEKMIHNLR